MNNYKVYYEIQKHFGKPDGWKLNQTYTDEFEAEDKEEAKYLFNHWASKCFTEYKIIKIARLVEIKTYIEELD